MAPNPYTDHSTKVGGSSSRTIITRVTRSSCMSDLAPARAASSVGYAGHVAERLDAEPRLTVAISLNIVPQDPASGPKRRFVRQPGLLLRGAGVGNFRLASIRVS